MTPDTVPDDDNKVCRNVNTYFSLVCRTPENICSLGVIKNKKKNQILPSLVLLANRECLLITTNISKFGCNLFSTNLQSFIGIG